CSQSLLHRCTALFLLFFFKRSRAHRDLLSFPTRRSSDLDPVYVDVGYRVPVCEQDRIMPVRAVDVGPRDLTLDAQDPLPNLVIVTNLASTEKTIERIVVDGPLREEIIVRFKNGGVR